MTARESSNTIAFFITSTSNLNNDRATFEDVRYHVSFFSSGFLLFVSCTIIEGDLKQRIGYEPLASQIDRVRFK